MELNYDGHVQRSFASHVTVRKEDSDGVTMSVGLGENHRISGLSEKQAEEARDVLLYAMNAATKITRKERILIVEDRRNWFRRQLVIISGLVGVVAIGWAMGSAALQWIGGILFVLCLISFNLTRRIRLERTIQETRDYLDELEQDS